MKDSDADVGGEALEDSSWGTLRKRFSRVRRFAGAFERPPVRWLGPADPNSGIGEVWDDPASETSGNVAWDLRNIQF